MIYRNISEILKSYQIWNRKLQFLAAEISNLSLQQSSFPNRRKPKNRHRNRGYALEELSDLSDALFKIMLRIDRPSFDYLVLLLKQTLDRSEFLSINSSGSPITTSTRLAVTLRWLAGVELCDARILISFNLNILIN